jgi:predicted NUDIX family phosphoesterase
MARKMEHILAMSRTAADKIAGYKSGFFPFSEGAERFPVEIDDLWVGSRDILEQDTEYAQIIPYAIVERFGNVLVYRRTNKGGESRLHDNWSIGFGGHISVGDISVSKDGNLIDLETTVANCTLRELNEELKIEAGMSFEAYGYLRSYKTEVDEVHSGFVMIARTESMVVEQEDAIEIVGWRSPEDLYKSAEFEKLESWSKIVIKYVAENGGLPKP